LVHAKGAQEFVIAETDEDEMAGFHSVAFDGTNFLVAYSNINSTTSVYTIYAQRYDVSGSAVGSLINVSGASGMEGAPLVAFDGTNYLIISETGGDPVVSSIKGQFVDTAGGLVGGAFTVATSTISESALAFDGTDYLVVWNDVRSGDKDVYGQRVSQAGSLVGGEFVISSKANNQKDASVAFGGGKYLVTFSDMNNVGGQFVLPDGTLSGGEIPIHQNAFLSDNPAPVIFDGTDFVVAYHDDPAGTWDLYAAKVSVAGVVSSSMPIADAPGTQVFPTIVPNGSEYIITWMDGELFSSTATIQQRSFASDLSPIGSAETVASAVSGKAAWTVSVAMGGGKYLAAINREDVPAQLDATNNNDLYGLFLSTAGGAAGSGFAGDFAQVGGATFDGGDFDMGTAVAVDTFTAGGPYVYAVAMSSQTGMEQALVVKYDSSGTLISSTTFSDGVGLDIALNTNGVYVTAQQLSPLAWVTLRYNLDLSFSTSAYLMGDFGARGIALDDSGSVYVAGGGGTPPNDFKVVKYDWNLNFVNSATFDGGAEEYGRSVAVDGSGSVYVTGESLQGGATRFVTVKYDPTLVMLASATYADGMPFISRHEGMERLSIAAGHASGFVYVVGTDGMASPSNRDILTIKYDTNLAQITTATYAAGQEGADVAVDVFDNVYVIGDAYYDGSPTGDDWVAIQYDQDLVIQSTKGYAGSGGDYPQGIALDSFNYAYVTGASSPDPFDDSTFDMRTMKFAMPAAPPLSVAQAFPPALNFTNGQSADLVLGQDNFTAALKNKDGTNTVNQSGLRSPYDITVDPEGRVWVVGYGNSRMLRFDSLSANGENASLVLGAADFASSGCPGSTSAKDFCNQFGATVDSEGNLWVGDTGRGRVLRFSPPFSNYQAADLVIGEPTFTSLSYGPSQTDLGGPSDLAIGPDGALWVADYDNTRILRFSPPFANGMAADVVLGQGDFVSNGGGTTATKFSDLEGIAVDAAGNVWVGDDGNNRVLRFSPPFTNGMAADLVLGQTDFVTGTAGLLSSSAGLEFDAAGNLWVLNYDHTRILRFDAPITGGNPAPSVVIGQPDFATFDFATTAAGFAGVYRDIALDRQGNLWVSDTSSNRVMRFSGSAGGAAPTASTVTVTGHLAAASGVEASSPGESVAGVGVILDTSTANPPTIYLLTQNMANYSAALVKLSSAGVFISSTSDVHSAGHYSPTVDLSGFLYVGGNLVDQVTYASTGTLRKYSSSLERVAQVQVDPAVTGGYMDLIAVNDVLFTVNDGGGSGNAKVFKFDTTTMSLLSTATIAGFAYGHAIAADPQNQLVYATAGTDITGGSRVIRKYDFNLNQLGSTDISGQVPREGGLAVGSAGDVFVSYYIEASSQAKVAKFSSGLAFQNDVTMTTAAIAGKPHNLRTANNHVYSIWEANPGPFGDYKLYEHNENLGFVSSTQYDRNGEDDEGKALAVHGQYSYMAGASGSPTSKARLLRRSNNGYTPPLETDGFWGIAFDYMGNLWASNQGLDSVKKYVSPTSPVTEATAADAQLTGTPGPRGVAFDSAGNLWVNVSSAPAASGAPANLLAKFKDQGGGMISLTSSAVLSGNLDEANAFVFQKTNTGNLFVANEGAALPAEQSVVEFFNTGDLAAPSFDNISVNPFAYGSDLAEPTGIAFDTEKNLWVAAGSAIRMYPNIGGGTIDSSTAEVRTGLDKPFAIAFDNAGNLFVSNTDPGDAPGSGSLWRYQNWGTAFAVNLASAPVLVQSGVDIASLAFDPMSGALWGTEYNTSEVIQLSSAAAVGPQDFGAIAGQLSYTGSAGPGTYYLAVSPDPLKVELSDPGTQLVAVSSGTFLIPNLPAPSTYFIKALLDLDGSQSPDGFEPFGWYSVSTAPVPSAPVFVAANSTATGVNLQLFDLVAVTGTITNSSFQSGEIRVQAWLGPPSDTQPQNIFWDDGLGHGATQYAIYVPTTTGSNLYVEAYVDAFADMRKQPGEDGGVAGPLSPVTPGTTIFANIDIGFSSGALVFVQGQDMAPQSLPGDVYDRAMLGLAMYTDGGSAQMSSLRVSLGGDAPSAQVQASLFRDDNGTLALEPGAGQDGFMGSSFFGAGSPPQAVIHFTTETLSATTQYYFVALNYNNIPAGNEIGVGVEEPSHIGLSLGAMAPQPATYPIRSGIALVKFSLFANPDQGGYPIPGSIPIQGGFDTGLGVGVGQNVEINAAGSWGSGGGNPPSGPGGLGGQFGGLDPGFNIGALAARVGYSPWFQVGSSITFQSTQSGQLVLAMNDVDYSDNSGSISVDFKVLSSTVTRVWTGASIYNKDASTPDNWQGGVKPLSGDRVLFDGAVSSEDCKWDIVGIDLGLLTMTTSYAGTVRIVGPSGAGSYNQLNVSSHVIIRGGILDMGENTTLEVQGQVQVAGGTLDMGSQYTHLRAGRLGVVVSQGGTFRSVGYGWVVIEPVSSERVPFTVLDGTVNVNNMGYTQFDESAGVSILLTSAAVTSFDYVAFQNFGPNPLPSLILQAATPVAKTFRNHDYRMDVSTNVDAALVAPGSAITMLNASGEKFGSPNERDPFRVVTWIPDGGGQASVSGTVYFAGVPQSDYRLHASTDPRGAFHSAPPTCPPAPTTGGGAMACEIVVSSGIPYNVVGLPAPNTWYFFAYLDGSYDNMPNGFEPRGGYQNPGSLRSDPVFLNTGASASSVDITLEDWGLVEGNVTNDSNQFGPIVILAALSGSTTTVEARGYAPDAGGFYSLYTRAATYDMIAFVDVNGNGEPDDFEASGTAAGVAVTALSTTTSVNIAITGGSAVAGGVGVVTPQTAHEGFIGTNGDNAMLRLDVFAAASDITLNGLRVDFSGSVPPNNYSIALWRDDNFNQLFDPYAMGGAGANDMQVAYREYSGGTSSGTLNLWGAEQLLSGTTRTFFVTLDLYGQKIPVAALKLAASTYFGLSQGEMADQPGLYPIQTSSAAVLFAVPADMYVQAPADGGIDTGLFVETGLTVTVTATGTWSLDGYQDVGPGGLPGTEYQNTVLPDAKRGELIGRIGGGWSWFRVGTGTSVVAETPGTLFLGMNDFGGDYFNNTGHVYADFSISGSTTGAVEGTITYLGAQTGDLFVRASEVYCPTCQPFIASTATLTLIPGTTLYNYTLGGLRPGMYDVDAYVQSSPSQRGGATGVNVVSGSTATGVDFELSLGAASIAGAISYQGYQNFGDYYVLVTTVTDLEGHVEFAGELIQSASGPYTLSGLKAPATYYILAFRDGNYDGRPEGPEPFGALASVAPEALSIYGSSQVLTAVVVNPGDSLTGKNITMTDRGAVNGRLYFQVAVAGDPRIVVQAAHGLPGSPGYTIDNRSFVRPGPVAAGSMIDYQVDLLRPATDYSIFAFVDSNLNKTHDPGEFFGQTQQLRSVPQGGGVNIDVQIKGPQAPGEVLGFAGSALSTTQVRWMWDASPGATAYHLLNAGAGAVASLA
ncbi:MAG: esterase-like activity of phytase family protein, partial [Elusimicrobiota bacterium]